MRRWIAERLDDALLPFLKMLAPGYRQRLGSYKEPGACEVRSLAALGAPERVELIAEADWQGYRSQRFRFQSLVQCMHDENQVAAGRLLWSSATAPWVLIIPGFATGAWRPYSFDLFQTVHARALLARGINTALIELPFHMSRKRPGTMSGEGFFGPDLAQTQWAVQQSAADAIATFRWLQGQSAKEVGVWGTSLGGCVAGLVATQVADLAALVLMEPLDNPGETLSVLPGAADIRARLSRESLAPGRLAELLRSVAPSSYPPATPTERMLFITPKWDRVVPTRFQEAFWKAWGKPERLLVDASHTTAAADPVIVERAADFLARWLLT